jgi:hypothetical protein
MVGSRGRKQTGRNSFCNNRGARPAASARRSAPVPETGGQRPRKAACGPGPTAGTRYIIFHSGTASPLSSSEESLPSQILKPEALPAVLRRCIYWELWSRVAQLPGTLPCPAWMLQTACLRTCTGTLLRALVLSRALHTAQGDVRPRLDGRPPGPDIGGLQQPCGRPPYDDTGRFGPSSSCPDSSLPTQPE